MATFNRASFIVESLQSIKRQAFEDWECIIIDDGGTDNTEELLNPLLEEDQRFKYLKRTSNYKKGLPGSRNYGLDQATGDFIIFFDDDDVVHPLNLEVCLSILKASNQLNFCNYKKESFIGEFDYDRIEINTKYKLVEVDEGVLEKVVSNQIPFASCTVLWRSSCFNNERFNEELMYAEEWEFYSRMLSNNCKGALIDSILYFNRKHSNSNTGEFWKNIPVRVNSKKKAIGLILENLANQDLLSPYLRSYLLNLAISFRDFKLLDSLLEKITPGLKLRLFYLIKYHLFPFWLFYKNKLKPKVKHS